MGDDTRMNVAKRLLTRMVDSLEKIEELEIALRVYGHRQDKDDYDCEDTRLEVGFAKKNHDEIKYHIREIRPKGTTLIAYSLQQAAYDFPTESSSRNIIILITDGIEECNGDPCAVSQALQKQGVVLKPFIIGVGLDEDFKEQFDCVGKYFEASTEDAFENVLKTVVSQALDNTTCQVNLLNTDGKPLETNVNISFVDAYSGAHITNVVHTLNKHGVPDTIYLDPAHDYDVIIHTIPPIRIEDVELPAGKHTTIETKAPMGNLELIVNGISGYGRLNAIVYKAGTKEIVHVQEFNTKEPYITGKYDVEILCLPRKFQKNVPIVQSKKTKLEIAQPGSVNLITKSSYWGDVYKLTAGERIWVCNIDINGANEKIILQPGAYSVVLRGKDDKNVINSKEINFNVNSGKITNIKI
jgi:Ca-activated chloride channel family protein